MIPQTNIFNAACRNVRESESLWGFKESKSCKMTFRIFKALYLKTNATALWLEYNANANTQGAQTGAKCSGLRLGLG